MDIRIIKTGYIFYQIDSQLAAILCAALPEQIEKFIPPPPPPKKAEWSVGTNNFGDKVLLWLKTPAGESVPWSGEPERAEAFFAKNYPNCLPIPASVLAHYSARRPRPQDAALAERERFERERRAAEAVEQNHGVLWNYPSNR